MCQWVRLLGATGGGQVHKGPMATQTFGFQPEGEQQPPRGEAGNTEPFVLSPPTALRPKTCVSEETVRRWWC